MVQPSNKYTLADAILAGIKAEQLEQHTALPGEIQSYEAATQTAQVRIAIDPVKSGETVPYPILDGIPVCFPRSNGYGVTFPLAKGDSVLLVFNERNTDLWRATGAGQPPSDARRFNINDAVAIPGYFPTPGVMIPPPVEATELRGDKIFIGDPLEFTSPVITALGSGSTPGTPALVNIPPGQLDLLQIIEILITLVRDSFFGVTPGPSGGGGAIQEDAQDALTDLIADLRKLKV